jgi:hypothetical protein
MFVGWFLPSGLQKMRMLLTTFIVDKFLFQDRKFWISLFRPLNKKQIQSTAWYFYDFHFYSIRGKNLYAPARLLSKVRSLSNQTIDKREAPAR